MKHIRLSAIAALVAAAIAGGALYGTAQKVQTADAEYKKLSAAIEGERKTIRVLRAEWDYLNRPERLESLARDHLNMATPQAGQVAAIEELPDIAPSAAASVEEMATFAAQPAVLSRAPPVPRSKPVRRENPRGFQAVLDELDAAKGEQ